MIVSMPGLVQRGPALDRVPLQGAGLLICYRWQGRLGDVYDNGAKYVETHQDEERSHVGTGDVEYYSDCYGAAHAEYHRYRPTNGRVSLQCGAGRSTAPTGTR